MRSCVFSAIYLKMHVYLHSLQREDEGDLSSVTHLLLSVPRAQKKHHGWLWRYVAVRLTISIFIHFIERAGIKRHTETFCLSHRHGHQTHQQAGLRPGLRGHPEAVLPRVWCFPLHHQPPKERPVSGGHPEETGGSWGPEESKFASNHVYLSQLSRFTSVRATKPFLTRSLS